MDLENPAGIFRDIFLNWRIDALFTASVWIIMLLSFLK